MVCFFVRSVALINLGGGGGNGIPQRVCVVLNLFKMKTSIAKTCCEQKFVARWMMADGRA
jgi:hypothetical protein